MVPRGRQERGLRRLRTSNGRHCSDAGRASAGQSGGQEDLGLPLQFHCSQGAKVIADFARTTSVLGDSTVLSRNTYTRDWSVVNAVCDSGPVLGEFRSDE